MGGNWIHIIVILIVVGFSAASWAAQKLKEQQAVREKRRAAEERRTEMLRTGRDPQAEAAQSEAAADERRRRQQAQVEAIERMRRERLERQAQTRGAPQGRPAGQGQASGQSGQGQVIVYGPSGPTRVPQPPQGGGGVQLPRVPPPPGSGQRLPQQTSADRRREAREREDARRREAELQRAPARQAPNRSAQRVQHRQSLDEGAIRQAVQAAEHQGLRYRRTAEEVRSAYDIDAGSPAAMLVGEPLDVKTMRKAVILSEILQPPVALREGQIGSNLP